MWSRIFFLILLTISARADESARVAANCAAQKTFLTSGMLKAKSLSEVLRRASQSETKIIVFGEAHTEDSERFYEWAIQKLKSLDSRLDCLLIEQPKSKYETALEACRHDPHCDRSRLPVFSGVRPALSSGLKVYAVDAVANTGAANFLDDVTNRNRTMTDETVALFKSRQCRRALMIVGALHVHRDPRITSLAELLEERRLPNYRIELLSPGLNSFGQFDARWIWQTAAGEALCPEVPGVIGGNFSFLHGETARAAISYFGPYSDPFNGPSEFVGRWGDFDAAVMLGCPDPRVSRCAPSGAGGQKPAYLELTRRN